MKKYEGGSIINRMVRKISAKRSDPARLHSSRHHGRVMVGDAKFSKVKKILPPTDTKREAGRSTDRSPVASSISPSHPPYCPGAPTTTKVRSQPLKISSQLELLTIYRIEILSTTFFLEQKELERMVGILAQVDDISRGLRGADV